MKNNGTAHLLSVLGNHAKRTGHVAQCSQTTERKKNSMALENILKDFRLWELISEPLDQRLTQLATRAPIELYSPMDIIPPKIPFSMIELQKEDKLTDKWELDKASSYLLSCSCVPNAQMSARDHSSPEVPVISADDTPFVTSGQPNL